MLSVSFPLFQLLSNTLIQSKRFISLSHAHIAGWHTAGIVSMFHPSSSSGSLIVPSSRQSGRALSAPNFYNSYMQRVLTLHSQGFANLLSGFSHLVCMASIKCKDVGFDCSFEANGTTELDAIRQFIEHIESTHKIPVLTSDVIFRLKTGIKK